MAPLDPALPAFAVDSVTCPLLDCALAPLRTITLPPVTELLEPASICSGAPWPLPLCPTLTAMLPADPLAAFPDFKLIDPAESVAAFPVPIMIAPLIPSKPEFVVDNVTCPPFAVELPPLRTAIWPPVVIAEVPAVKEMLPPSELLDPADTITDPDASDDDAPLCTETDPESDPDDSPVCIMTAPLEPSDPDNADLISILPPTPVAELPATRDIAPPVSAVLSPDLTTTLAPTPLPDVAPASIKNEPDTPLIALPVFTFKSPERPALEVPETTSTLPLLKDVDVAILTLPLPLALELPLLITIDPPVDCELSPADTAMDPPTELVAAWFFNTMLPDAAVLELPLAMITSPESPDSLSPVFIIKVPLVPVASASPELTVTLPLTPSVLAPDVN